ncbi:MAG: insulinase family protein, partial [Salinisphaera sp.]|nr:insulinase family protein [Salinisphaera sp.]
MKPAGGASKQAADQTAVKKTLSPLPQVKIPYQKFVLANGLTLSVHEDHDTPIVSVNTWYHVGSKNEGPEQHGFAHLFEHLMFQGTEHWHGEYFEPFEKAGATSMNGTTNADRTNYFANVPTNALDMALWMESDRMGYLLGGIDQAALDEQVGVVINEMKQGANQPYGMVWRIIPGNTYPQGHPYSWPTIGNKDDLKAATLDDVRAWFKRYYGPTNATLVVAGDVDTETVRKKVEHYFGAIPAGPPLEQQQSWIAPMQGEHRQVMHDQVPQARIYKVWNIPPAGSAAATRLGLAADLLAGSKNSPLYKRLVYDDQIATNVSASIWSKEIGSQFIISATARAGVPLAKVEQALDEELARFLAEGPDPQALQRTRTTSIAGFIRAAERVGGYGGKSAILARGEVFHGDPGYYKKYMQTLREADAQTVRKAAAKWLSDGVYVLEVLPFGEHHTTDTAVDRSTLPAFGDFPDLDLPTLQKVTLDNGLQVWLAERDTAPLVELRMVFDAGYAADPADAPGTASMTLAMMDEGAGARDALEISAAISRLGAQLASSSSLDASVISLSSLSSRLDASMGLYADVILRPTFPEQELQRLKRLRLADIAQEQHSPVSMAMRLLGPLLYGDKHAYSVPLTGSGTAAAVKAMTVDDLQTFHRHWIRPDNATLVVVGDVDMATLKPLLKEHFGGWKAGDAAAPEKSFPEQPKPDHQRVFLVNRPGAIQTTVIAANLAPPKSNPQNIAMTTVNTILGGMFSSRLNMNLREDKHWSYGAGSLLLDARAQ